MGSTMEKIHLFFALRCLAASVSRVFRHTQPLFTVAGASCVASRDSERTVSLKDCRTLPFSACECSSQSNLHSNYIADSEVGDGVWYIHAFAVVEISLSEPPTHSPLGTALVMTQLTFDKKAGGLLAHCEWEGWSYIYIYIFIHASIQLYTYINYLQYISELLIHRIGWWKK